MQESLFFEDVNDALRECVRALGGAKVVGAQLWPEKTVEQAQQALLACLNSDRKERLTPEQLMMVLRLARAKGVHGPKQWIDGELGYQPSQPVEPADEIAELQREFIGATHRMERLAERLQGLGLLRVAK